MNVSILVILIIVIHDVWGALPSFQKVGFVRWKGVKVGVGQGAYQMSKFLLFMIKYVKNFMAIK